MKKAFLDCNECSYKSGLIQTLFDPCERCKERHIEALCDKTVYEFLRKYQKQK